MLLLEVKVKRWWRLYQAFVKISLITDLQYRSSFWLILLTYTGWGLVYIFLYQFIFAHIDKVGDWTYERGLVLTATFLIIHALTRFLFGRNLRNFAQLIYLGDLDLILLKPVNSQFYVSLRQFFINPFLRFIIAWVVLVLVVIKNGIVLSWSSIMIYFGYYVDTARNVNIN